jgi:hypothetical protein
MKRMLHIIVTISLLLQGAAPVFAQTLEPPLETPAPIETVTPFVETTTTPESTATEIAPTDTPTPEPTPTNPEPTILVPTETPTATPVVDESSVVVEPYSILLNVSPEYINPGGEFVLHWQVVSTIELPKDARLSIYLPFDVEL